MSDVLGTGKLNKRNIGILRKAMDDNLFLTLIKKRKENRETAENIAKSVLFQSVQ